MINTVRDKRRTERRINVVGLKMDLHKQMIFKFAIACCAVFSSSILMADDTIRLWHRNFDRSYHLEAITNILDLSKDRYGDYTLLRAEPTEQGRAFSDLVGNKSIDLMSAGISKEREQIAAHIYIPLERGLLGFRVCIVGRQQKNLSHIRTLKDLQQQQFSVGVGAHWPDRLVLESNGLNTVTSAKYKNLFPMLKKNRFDCFSRSLIELDVELATYAKQGLQIDKELLLVYPLPDFLVVSKDNQRLKARLEYGTQKAVDNDSFFKIFNRHHDDILRRYDVYNRRIIYLQNNNLSTESLQAINKYGLASFMVR